MIDKLVVMMNSKTIMPNASETQAIPTYNPDTNPNDTSWQEFGSCRDKDPNIFFPEAGEDIAPAVRICSKCVVKEACLEYAITTKQPKGVWGGESVRARGRIRKARLSESE